MRWVLGLLQTAQCSKDPPRAEQFLTMQQGRKAKSTKHMGWGPKMWLFLLAFGIIALLGEQPFSKWGSWACSPASKGVRREQSWAGEGRNYK